MSELRTDLCHCFGFAQGAALKGHWSSTAAGLSLQSSAACEHCFVVSITFAVRRSQACSNSSLQIIHSFYFGVAVYIYIYIV